MLSSIAYKLNPESGIYICYNKSVATEAQNRFPRTVSCMTTHSLAFKFTVPVFKLKLGSFTYRSISESIGYDQKIILVDLIREFCLSRYTSFVDFAQEQDVTKESITLANKYLGLMQSGAIECSHDFYLKLFHILLATGSVTFTPFDILFLDEAGDLNEVTLEIFKYLPALRKVMVGDPYQNIYTFNHTINCFTVMGNEGTTLPMSQSFRVEASVAFRIENFCQKYIDPSFHFKGVVYDSPPEIKTRAYIARTNAALISKMMELNSLGIQYGLTRTAKQIFELPLALCSLKYQGFLANPVYKHLQEDVDDWFESKELQSKYKSPLLHIKNMHAEDRALQVAIRAILQYKPSGIIQCYEEARKHEKSSQSYMLGTSHSMKGMEVDEVTIAPDLNEAVSDIISLIEAGIPYSKLAPEQQAELNLYYVAVSRSRVKLNAAIWL